MNDYKGSEEITTVKMGFVNSYIIKGKNRLILVDAELPGNAQKILNKVQEIGFKANQVSLIILTHVHFDHTGSLKELKNITGAKVAVHKNDAPYLMEGKSAEAVPITGFGKFMMRMVKNRPPKIKEKVKPDILIGDKMDLDEFGIREKSSQHPAIRLALCQYFLTAVIAFRGI